MTADTNYVRYSADIERVAPDEADTIKGIVASMTHESEITAERYKHAVRASHAKSHGLLKGELRVFDGLPAPLRQGLFATPATYPVAVRMAVGPGELLSDAVSTHRGMAIKVFGAQGAKLPGHDADTQDFVLATGPAFPQADAPGFLRAMKGLEGATSKSEGFKQAVSTAARVTPGLHGRRDVVSPVAQPRRAPPARLADARAPRHLPAAVRLPPRAQRAGAARAAHAGRHPGLTVPAPTGAAPTATPTIDAHDRCQ